MHINEYALEVITRERLAELRKAAERSIRLRAAIPASHPLRDALVRLGRRARAVMGHSWVVGRERTSVRGALRE